MGHVSHTKKKQRRKTAARALLVLGIVFVVGSLVRFSYDARIQAGCSATTSDVLTATRWLYPDPLDCIEAPLSIEERLQHDALVAIPGILLASGSGILLSKFRRETKRLLLMTEVAVVTIGLFYAILLASVLR